VRLLKQGLAQPAVKKLFIFLILQGLCMPQFLDFDYYFAVDVLKVSPATVSLQPLYIGWLLILIPFIYQGLFRHRNYVLLFALSQLVCVAAESTNLFLATRYN